MSLRGIKAYQKGNLKQDISTADPHKLTLLLIQGALDRIAYAKGAIERKDLVAKSGFISKSTSIIMHLRDTLDFNAGGEISNNLYSLYSYILDRINEAHLHNSVEPLDESYSLLEPIRDAWAQIPESAKQEAYANQQRESLG
ncbi:flagellar export chaperone FliS [Alteromonas sp. Cnat3-28]|jgi:flagellar protein FliS|uniref:Flagellar secretion chaperone FliS n=1 Tax=Alteromonas mediterranea 615 TaxID=1300253 RepID=S5AKW3_9ALTE|nr:MULTISPECIES: flagellar export chaperone FliS [Alteromonas]AGP77298.1 flagellar protein FliS [Alteromonas mediterranea 615]AGP92786.1 flagellar protein FliS [Alteromonas mediterranea U8]AGP84800.1 flagellar protein FliS [Alteromonas mediterranea U4]AGP88932.1 flagellar protein FliS [Alteromonas mediterranea U7]MCG7645113.1 flagellar export chaperone FliS [Alteromonas sp. Cnat3-28]|tara:strand:+ start:34 stop:459 length:426 start_codon:yes stop_codon:yes gene_type:complete